MVPTPPTYELDGAANPYLGPRPFTQADAYRFFGREREAAELYSLVAAHRTVLLYAPSGAGKTSLLHAGLIPMLNRGGFDVLPPARVSGLREPALAEYKLTEGARLRSVENIYVLNCAQAWAYDDHRISLDAALTTLLANRSQPTDTRDEPMPRVAVFDQFEELFTAYPERWPERRGFLEQLNAAMAVDPLLRVLFAMREDFVAHIDAYEDLLPEEFRTRYRLEQLRDFAALDAVDKPLGETGLRFKPGVAQRLVSDLLRMPVGSPGRVTATGENPARYEEEAHSGYVVGEFVEPVQLQVVCFNLFRNLPTNTKEITEDHLSAFGDVDEALGGFYQESLKEAAARAEIGEDSLRPWFERNLITEAGTRGLVFRGETATAGIPNSAVDALDELHVIRAEVRAGQRWYELSHDRFIQPILLANTAWRVRVQWAEIQRREEESRRLIREARTLRRLVAALGAMLLIAGYLGVMVWTERGRAEENLRQAKNAVDEMLSSAGRQPARVGADVPQLEEFRRELLEKAKGFYASFTKQEPRSEELRQETALAHFRLGDINRLLENPEDAVKQYKDAIGQFQVLAREYPRKAVYRQELANCYNWLAETQRPFGTNRAQAEQAYTDALALQQDLLHSDPGNAQYQEELARTHYNRGILYFQSGRLDDSDFRQAIRLLEPLAQKSADPAPAQELARAYNNLGALLAQKNQVTEARKFYEGAITILERLTKRQPGNREYKLELATYYDDLAGLLLDDGKSDLARQRNGQGIDLIEELASPVPSLQMDLAYAHYLRGRILESHGSLREAESEYQQSIEMFKNLQKTRALQDVSEFHYRFGEVLFSAAALRHESDDFEGARRLLAQAILEHSEAGSPGSLALAYDYLELANDNLALGALADAQNVLENLLRLLPALPEPDRSSLTRSSEELRERMEKRK